MKNTGIVRQVDEMGRLVLPKELRKTFDLNDKDAVEFFTDGDKIVLKKYMPCCIFCGSADDMVLYKGKLICDTCAKNIEVLNNNK